MKQVIWLKTLWTIINGWLEKSFGDKEAVQWKSVDVVAAACHESCIGTNFIAVSRFPLLSLSLFNSYPGLDFLCFWTLWRSWVITLEGGGWNSGWKWRGWQAATWEKMHRVLKIRTRLYQEVKIGLIYMCMCAICTHSHRNTHAHTHSESSRVFPEENKK